MSTLDLASLRVSFFPNEANGHDGMNFPAGIGFHFFFGDAILFSPGRRCHVVRIEKKLPCDLHIRSRNAIATETGFLHAFKDMAIKKVPDFIAGILQGLIPFDKGRISRFYNEAGITPG